MVQNRLRSGLAAATSSNQPPRDGDEAPRRLGRPKGKLTQLQKVTRLQQLLVQYPRGVTIDEIASHLNVDPRSARRYVKALTTELRTDLEPVTDADGIKRWRIPDVDVPRRVALRRTQAYALLAARPLFGSMRGSTLYEEIDLASESLLGVARRPGRGPNAGHLSVLLEERFRYVPFAPKNYAARSEDLDNLFQSVADQRPISILYPTTDGTVTRLCVHPYALLLYKESIYALGLDVDDERVQAFELDYVRGSKLLDEERFPIPDSFRVEDFLQGQFGLWCADENTVEVVIDFAPLVASAVTARSFHPSQRLLPLEGGGVRLHLELGDTRELVSWVMGFGSLAVVREPESLRRDVKRSLEAALECYRDEASPVSRRAKPRSRL